MTQTPDVVGRGLSQPSARVCRGCHIESRVQIPVPQPLCLGIDEFVVAASPATHFAPRQLCFNIPKDLPQATRLIPTLYVQRRSGRVRTGQTHGLCEASIRRRAYVFRLISNSLFVPVLVTHWGASIREAMNTRALLSYRREPREPKHKTRNSRLFMLGPPRPPGRVRRDRGPSLRKRRDSSAVS